MQSSCPQLMDPSGLPARDAAAVYRSPPTPAIANRIVIGRFSGSSAEALVTSSVAVLLVKLRSAPGLRALSSSQLQPPDQFNHHVFPRRSSSLFHLCSPHDPHERSPQAGLQTQPRDSGEFFTLKKKLRRLPAVPFATAERHAIDRAGFFFPPICTPIADRIFPI